MIDKTHELSVTRQCQILELPRSTAYYPPAPESAENLALMRRIDELHLEFPFAGARMLRDLLRSEGIRAGRKRIDRLMAKMSIEALYRKPNTSKKAAGSYIYPYLLRNLTIDRPNQVWAADITYIPMRRGFVYRVAVVDWFSRKVLSWGVSNTLTTDVCLDAVREAIHRYGVPEIFNTDRQPIHQYRLHKAAQRARDSHQHGRQYGARPGRRRLRHRTRSHGGTLSHAAPGARI